MKLFTKRYKRIVVENHSFLCVIDYTPNHEYISFKIYPARTKTSIVSILFSWAVNWQTNLNTPRACAILIKYALQIGWDPTQEHHVIKIEQGDFLVDELRLREC
ncbi:hypothetical protein ACFSR7_06785 [Cohnella sp. GCM10020058]|uniref:hypothetical protein n=1 Tax=Cohnella sp. GCM10020058 TaxID=3317330 RepID=UPI00364104DC